MSASRRVLARSGGATPWLAAIVVIGLITTGAGISLSAFASWLLAHTAIVLTTSTASMVILAVRTSAIVRVVGRWCERWFGHRATFAVLTRIRVRVFRDLIPVSPIALSDRGSGDLVASIVDDVDTMQDHLLRVAVPTIVGTLAMLGTAALLTLLVSPACGSVALCGLAVNAMLLPFASARTTQRSSAALVELRAERETLIVEILAATDELQVWGASDSFARRIDAIDRIDAQSRRRLARSDAIITAARSIVTVATAMTTMALAHSAASSGAIDTPFIVVAPLVVLAAMEIAGPMGAAVATRARSEAAALRLLAIDDLPDRAVGTRTDATVPESAGIALVHTAFTHPGGPVVLTGQDLMIGRDETIVLTGASGAGKSTVADLLLRAVTPDRGSVEVLGCEVVGLSDRVAAERISALLQPDHLFDTTVRDNLRVGAPDATDDEMRSLLIELDLDLASNDVDVLDRPVGGDGSMLSGGERQRLLVARALLTDAPVLILDEPTEHIDPERRRSLVAAIRTRRTGRCTLILSHDPETETIADRVLRIGDGSISDDRR